MTTEGVIARHSHPELASALKWAARSGEVVSLLPGVVARSGAEGALEIRLRALHAWDPAVVVTEWAAARLSFWPGPDVATVSAAVRHHRAPRPGFAFSRRVIPSDLILERKQLRLTAPALTALDLCAETSGDAIDQVLRMRAATLAELRAALAATGNRRGNRRRRELLLESRAEPWSAAERLFHQLLREASITGWCANLAVTVDDTRYVLDVAFETLRLAIEIDGRMFHQDDAFESDRQRQNALVLDGWFVLRFTWAMLVDDPEGIIKKVREAMVLLATRRR